MCVYTSHAAKLVISLAIRIQIRQNLLRERSESIQSSFLDAVFMIMKLLFFIYILPILVEGARIAY